MKCFVGIKGYWVRAPQLPHPDPSQHKVPAAWGAGKPHELGAGCALSFLGELGESKASCSSVSPMGCSRVLAGTSEPSLPCRW